MNRKMGILAEAGVRHTKAVNRILNQDIRLAVENGMKVLYCIGENLIPAAYQRLLSQQVAASVAGVECIISFMFCGIIEKPDSPFQLGQPYWLGIAYRNYMDWSSNGGRYWRLLELLIVGHWVTASPFRPL